MQRREHFGRRAASQPAVRRERGPVLRAAPPSAPGLQKAEPIPSVQAILESSTSPDDELKRDIADYKAMRKIKKRSFREPWRSVSIASAIGFGLSSWLLPDSVDNIAQLITLGLTLASFYAGYRKRPGDDGRPAGEPSRF